MTKKLWLAVLLMAAALPSFAQRVREADVQYVWQDGLTASQVNAVNDFVRNMSDTNRWNVYSAVVRSKEFHRDYLPGEPMTSLKVLAAVRTRLSTEDTSKFNSFYSRLSSSQRNRLIGILRSIQVG